jgi:glutamate synthase (ferredoxin)
VTNPAIDPLREGLVMSLSMRLGPRGNLLLPRPEDHDNSAAAAGANGSGAGGAHPQIRLDSPVLLESDLAAIVAQDMVPCMVRRCCIHLTFDNAFRI